MTWSDKAFAGTTVVNWALPSLHEGSLEITLTVPLNAKNDYLTRTKYVHLKRAYYAIHLRKKKNCHLPKSKLLVFDPKAKRLQGSKTLNE